MKKIEIRAIDELTKFYKLYLKEKDEVNLKKMAKELYDSMPAITLVHKVITNAFGALFPIAYPDVGSGIQAPSKKNVKKIIRLLEERKKELKNIN